MARDRSYDVVLWGATGFTGQYVAEFLAERYGDADLAWAIAGRNEERLHALRARLAGIDEDLEDLAILTGDALEPETLEDIAAETHVVCAMVGPYAEYGSHMVAACVDQETDYCDLSGEVHWMRQMIDEHHETARDRGVRIVHGCGFDSVPSDLGTLLVQNHARQAFGTPCDRIDSYVSTSSTSMSGGTYASMVGMYDAMDANPDLRRVLESPYALAPPGERDGPDTETQDGPKYDETIDQWTAPFLMALINEKVVRRSNALLEYPWGREFRYHESTPMGSGVSGATRATGLAAGSFLLDRTMRVETLRGLLAEHLLPSPGEGPSQAEIEESGFEVRLVGTGVAQDTDEAFRIEGHVAADRHMGYGATPWMLGEAAVCLAQGETDSPLDGGVLTPASGIGMPLVERLRDVGMTFTVEDAST
jgi:short subunit dehydrogenase-like uncharacterized protein